VPNGPAMLGASVSLADLYLAPMMRYFTMAREGTDLLDARPRLSAWWQFMRERPSMEQTKSPIELTPT
jgi:glutathione S-transferase